MIKEQQQQQPIRSDSIRKAKEMELNICQHRPATSKSTEREKKECEAVLQINAAYYIIN